MRPIRMPKSLTVGKVEPDQISRLVWPTGAVLLDKNHPLRIDSVLPDHFVCNLGTGVCNAHAFVYVGCDHNARLPINGNLAFARIPIWGNEFHVVLFHSSENLSYCPPMKRQAVGEGFRLRIAG